MRLYKVPDLTRNRTKYKKETNNKNNKQKTVVPKIKYLGLNLTKCVQIYLQKNTNSGERNHRLSKEIERYPMFMYRKT